ncbi:MAG: TolC family protein [Marinobacter sp.]|nr:TolC family protein [Marinobacter sp.]
MNKVARRSWLCLMIPLWVSAPSVTADPVASLAASQGHYANLEGQRLGQRELLLGVIERNASALFSQLQLQLATDDIDRQRSAYQPSFFAESRFTSQRSENTASDRLSSVQRLNQDVFREKRLNVETGVRVPVKTGADVSVSWTALKRENNVIPLLNNPLSGDPVNDTEYAGALNLVIRQPLLRGLGNRSVEWQIQEAELNEVLTEQQFRQQLLRVSSEALSAYWQLFRLNQFVSIRQVALANARNIHQETENQVRAGRVPGSAQLESESTILERQAEHEAALQAWHDLQAELRTLLNLSGSEFQNLTFVPTDAPQMDAISAPEDFHSYTERLLAQWPGYLIAEKTREIEALKLRTAREEKRPQLDLALGYSTSSLSTRSRDPMERAFDTDYPTWYVGLEYNMPLGRDMRGQADERSARTRLTQAELDLHAIRVSVSNELRSRLRQLDQAYRELELSDRQQQLQDELFNTELRRFNAGQTRLRDLLEREDDRIRAQQRYVDSLVRYQLAIVALRLAEGTLFNDYGITIQSQRALADASLP